MSSNWFSIAKAEYKVQTSGLKKHRKAFAVGSFVIGLIWAFVGAPFLMRVIIVEMLQIPSSLLVMIMPDLMRAGIMFIWLMLLVIPLTNALQEVKIGQWEILLSNRVTTREILFGSFLGRVAIYGLYILYITPLLIAPFTQAFEVSAIGIGLMYLNIFCVTIGTLWLSNLIVTAVQSRLGSSLRGKDLANALAILLSIIAIVPVIGLQLFAPVIMEILGMDFFLIFPFTWGADLMTQIAIIFNGIGLTFSQFEMVLGLEYMLNLILLGGFSISIFAIGALTADRIFVIGESARTESVSTVQNENIFIRSVRRLSAGSFGILVVSGIKSFIRKAENLSRLALLLVLALIIPVFIFIRGGELELTSVTVMTCLMLGFLGVQVFGGVGFLESKNQLWTIQAAPKGVKRFIQSKAIQSLLLITPIALIPGVLYSILLDLGLMEIPVLLIANVMSCIGGALVGIGIASINPTYEDTKSGAYRTNNFRGMMLVALSFMSYLIVDFALAMIGFKEVMDMLWASETLAMIVQIIPLPFVGLIALVIGQHRLSLRE